VTRVEDWKTDGWFPVLGLKTKGMILAGIGAECSRRSEDRWRDREACVKAKQSREVAGSIRCYEKELDKIAPVWACTLISNIRVLPK